MKDHAKQLETSPEGQSKHERANGLERETNTHTHIKWNRKIKDQLALDENEIEYHIAIYMFTWN